MLKLHTEIEIESPAEWVWSILTDFPSYGQWNPFIRRIQGSPTVGSSLHVYIQPAGTKAMAMNVRPTVLVADRPWELRWRGRVLMPGIFDGEYRFAIRALTDQRVRFEQSERFSGILVPFFRATLTRDARHGFAEMNAALKQRAERMGTTIPVAGPVLPPRPR
jgi:hypothetical protein